LFALIENFISPVELDPGDTAHRDLERPFPPHRHAPEETATRPKLKLTGDYFTVKAGEPMTAKEERSRCAQAHRLLSFTAEPTDHPAQARLTP
jgi:hypothetical protein